MMSMLKLIALLVLCSLGGCAAPNSQFAPGGSLPPVAQQPPVTAGPLIAVTPAQQPQAIGKQVGATPGKRQRVNFLAAINPDCTSIGPSTFELVSRPAHGIVEFEAAEDFGYWVPNNPRSKCNTRRVSGTAVYYTSEPNFRGLDAFVMTILTAYGQRTTIPISVTVQ